MGKAKDPAGGPIKLDAMFWPGAVMSGLLLLSLVGPGLLKKAMSPTMSSGRETASPFTLVHVFRETNAPTVMASVEVPGEATSVLLKTFTGEVVEKKPTSLTLLQN